VKTAWVAPFFVITFISFAVYFNALSCGFVYDDMAQVLENPWIRDVQYVPEMFGKSVSGFVAGSAPVNYYRPLMHLIYLVNYYLFGLTPRGFHLVNILFHAGNSILVFVLATRLLKGPSPEECGGAPPLHVSRSTISDSRFFAFLAALLFAVHPIHTEAVTWVAGLPDVSFTFFFLLSFWFYMRFREGVVRAYKPAGDYLLSLASFAIATFLKEPALTLPFVLILYDRVFKKERANMLQALKRYFPYVLVSLCYLLLRLNALGDISPVKAYPELSAWQLVINIFPLFTEYIEKLFLPVNLNVWHTFHPITSLLTAKSIISLLVTGAFGVFGYVALRKNAEAFMALALFLLPLLPVLYIPGIVGKPLAERYLYLPSFGFVLLCSLIAELAVKKGVRKTYIAVVFLLVAGAFSVATVKRNAVWEDNYTLFNDTTQKSPEAFAPRYGFANALFEKGRIDEAIEQYRLALASGPVDPEVVSSVLSNVGTALLHRGLTDQAIEQYSLAVTAAPGSSEAHAGLGFAYAEKGWPEKAISEYVTALKLQPHSPARAADIHNNLGVVYWKMGLTDQARAEFEAAARMDPGNASFAENLRKAQDPAGDLKKDH
jgi:protein O-mannosyl-transferase